MQALKPPPAQPRDNLVLGARCATNPLGARQTGKSPESHPEPCQPAIRRSTHSGGREGFRKAKAKDTNNRWKRPAPEHYQRPPFRTEWRFTHGNLLAAGRIAGSRPRVLLTYRE